MRRTAPLILVPVLAAALLSLPAFAQTAPFLSGCPVFPADNIWNTPVDHLPLDLNSSAYIASIGAGTGVHPDFGSGLWDGGPIGIPYNIVPGSQPRVQITFDYWDESDPGPYPIPSDAEIEGGSESSGDRHVLILDEDNCILYETWSTYPQPDGSWEAGSGAVFDLRSNNLRPSGWTSSDAAGLPVLPGLARYEEVAAGEINHALRFTVPRTRREYIWPARHYASSLTSSNYPPMGQRFRLRADFDISDFSREVQVILRALKKYGMILADNGSAWYISGAPDPRWNNDVLVRELRRVSGSDFEAIDESSLMISPDSGRALRTDIDTQPPAAPTGLAATVVSSSQIDLEWNASTDDIGVEGYRIYRNGVQIAATVSLFYQSVGLVPSTGYTYHVSAYDAAGNISLQSDSVSATTFPVPSKAFRIGDRVRTNEQVDVRFALSAPGGIIGTQPKGASGTVASGPMYWENQWWWDIDFVSGFDGWVTETEIKKVSRPVRSRVTRSRAQPHVRILR
ncbi:MAG: fibronectin type III domain-containing protein [Acidobacteria bacterium]|nr:fibronectin type III domain-containing protein [Acidobacteriota bacterium]